jgi:hypothetical protein
MMGSLASNNASCKDEPMSSNAVPQNAPPNPDRHLVSSRTPMGNPSVANAM